MPGTQEIIDEALKAKVERGETATARQEENKKQEQVSPGEITDDLGVD